MDMEEEYRQITSQLDAREILRYLNNLGINNISGEVLKYFITDLKKLIKYEIENRHKELHFSEIQGPERLHSASTFSSRSRSKVNNGISLTCTRECLRKPKNMSTLRNTQSAPNVAEQKDEKPLRRACSCVRVERKPDSRDSAKERPASSNNLIKVPIQPAKKKCDPVSLYHYYTSMWTKYKNNVPGENDRADLRWNVRQKMVGNISRPNSAKVPQTKCNTQCRMPCSTKSNSS